MASGGMTPFVWAEGGQKKTPQQVERDRLLAAALMREGSQYTPLGSWTQGLARLANGIVGGLESRWADEAEQAGIEGARARIDPLIAALTGGQSAGGGFSPSTSPSSSYAPSSGGSFTPTPLAEGTEWLNYANQGATRRLPLNPELTNALSFLPELGVTMEVFSGGQPEAGQGPRVGSTRHDHGNAADVFFYRDGRRLDWANPEDLPIFEEIVRRGRASGVTGFGAGEGYMRPGSMHIGFGPEAVWGAGGSSENAPEWLRNAYYNASPAQQEAMAAEVMAYAPQGDGISNADLMGGTALDAIEQAAPTSDPMAMALAAPSPAPVQVAQAGGGNDLLASILSAQADPWAQQQYGGMLDSLLSNELTRINQANDPAYQMQLEREALELERLRNPWSAQPASPDQLAQWGIVPQPGESWTIGQDGTPQQVYAPAAAPEPIEVGGVLVDPITYQPIFDSRTEDTPAAIQEYQFYAQQAADSGQRPLPFDQWDLERRGRAASQVNVNAAPPAPPAGYQNVFDEEGRLLSQEIIEGGPAWQQASNALATAENTLGQIQQVVQDPNLGTAVGIGGILPAIPNTPQASLVGRIEQLQGAAFLQAFESLKGGGQITEVEGRKATEAIARLNRVQTQEDFITALNDLASVVHNGMNRARETIGQPSLGDFQPFTVNDPLAGNPDIQPDGSPTPTGNQTYGEGTIIENDFGQRMIMRNGQWEMM